MSDDAATDAVSDSVYFPTAFVQELLTLLDLIELQEDHTLARQRFEIARKHGLKVVVSQPTSSAIN